MSRFENLRDAIDAAPNLQAALDALLDGLAATIKATSNDQNVQKLSREMRLAAPGLVAALAGKPALAS